MKYRAGEHVLQNARLINFFLKLTSEMWCILKSNSAITMMDNIQLTIYNIIKSMFEKLEVKSPRNHELRISLNVALYKQKASELLESSDED